jgi:hypothetical protein
MNMSIPATQQQLTELYSWFRFPKHPVSVSSFITFDPINHSFDILTDVTAERMFDRLPVKFGRIGGNFNMAYTGLDTFEGFPRVIEGHCWCNQNKLTSFQGSPQVIEGNFLVQDNPISIMSGFPEHIQGLVSLDYTSQLPLLRLLSAKDGVGLGPASWPDQRKGEYAKVQNILNKYAGTGKRGMLGAAAELTKAGFRDNARW